MPSPMWNPATGVDRNCLAMEPMHQIMFLNQMPLGQTPCVQPWNWCVKSCFIINCQLLIPFTSGLSLQKWACSTSVHSPMWNPDTGTDKKFLAMEPMCQIMFYNQLPTSDTIHKWTLAPEVGLFHIGAFTRQGPISQLWHMLGSCDSVCLLIIK